MREREIREERRASMNKSGTEAKRKEVRRGEEDGDVIGIGDGGRNSIIVTCR